jgi:hypothetical protein
LAIFFGGNVAVAASNVYGTAAVSYEQFGADGGSGLRKPIFGYLFGVFGYKYKIPWSQGYKVCIVPAFDDAIIYCGLCLG